MARNFTLQEMTHSYTAQRLGINNTPPTEVLKHLDLTMERLEIVRGVIGLPITILSGYRSERLNRAIGGVDSSQHVTGQAADIISYPFGSAEKLAQRIIDNQFVIRFDQLILEFDSWVHISFTNKPRGEILRILSKHEGYMYWNGNS